MWHLILSNGKLKLKLKLKLEFDVINLIAYNQMSNKH
jgi:hypothetical protein